MITTIRRAGSAVSQTASVVVRRFQEGGAASIWCTAVLGLGVLGLVHGMVVEPDTLAGGFVAGEDGDPIEETLEYLLWLLGLLV